MSTPKSNVCPYCSRGMSVRVMECQHCDVSIQTVYPEMRLGSLPIEHQRFIEMFVLASGRLKGIANQTGVSYPTVRSRLDRIIEELRSRIADTSSETILDALDDTDRRSANGDPLDPRSSAKDLIKRI